MMIRTTEHDFRLKERVKTGLASLRAQFDIPGLYPLLARLLAEAKPVAMEQLCAAGGWSHEQVRAELARLGAEWDERGLIVGLGLTLRPTPHKFTFEDKTVYGWCASDALTFPILLGKGGVVESTCPITDQTIEVEVTPHAVHEVAPPQAVVSKVRPSQKVADLRADICGEGLFFASRDAAASWLARTPEGELESVADDFEIHRNIMEQIDWAARLR
jgi:alkylmercury lyase